MIVRNKPEIAKENFEFSTAAKTPVKEVFRSERKQRRIGETYECIAGDLAEEATTRRDREILLDVFCENSASKPVFKESLPFQTGPTFLEYESKPNKLDR